MTILSVTKCRIHYSLGSQYVINITIQPFILFMSEKKYSGYWKTVMYVTYTSSYQTSLRDATSLTESMKTTTVFQMAGMDCVGMMHETDRYNENNDA